MFLLAASLLWSAGHREWAFILAFTATWVLLSISWSNVEFTEQSGVILARVVDHNFNRMNEQIEQLEKDLAELKCQLGASLIRPDLESAAPAPRETGTAVTFSVSSGDG